MRNQLTLTYVSKAKHLAELERELSLLEDTLKSPARTTEDIVRHMEVLKEYHAFINAD